LAIIAAICHRTHARKTRDYAGLIIIFGFWNAPELGRVGTLKRIWW
jgi:hypothetical protein